MGTVTNVLSALAEADTRVKSAFRNLKRGQLGAIGEVRRFLKVSFQTILAPVAGLEGGGVVMGSAPLEATGRAGIERPPGRAVDLSA